MSSNFNPRRALVAATMTVAALGALVPLSSRADTPGAHPAYLHALSDLRAAYWLVQHRGGDYEMREQERFALREIGEAIGEINRAAINDGKSLEDAPPIDTRLDHNGRLHEAERLLHKVHQDVAHEEENGRNFELQDHALRHVDAAEHALERAINNNE